jgi:hypothetical protein
MEERSLVVRKQKPPKPRKKERPKTKPKRVSFSETPVGYLIRHVCPVEWNMLELLIEQRIRITPALVDQFTRKSDNPFFTTREFREAMADFRKHGYRTPKKKNFNLDTEIKYILERMQQRKTG